MFINIVILIILYNIIYKLILLSLKDYNKLNFS
jgi:hypothetical protein